MNDKEINLFVLNRILTLPVDSFVSLVYYYIDSNNLNSEDLDAALIRLGEKHKLRQEVINSIIHKRSNNN